MYALFTYKRLLCITISLILFLSSLVCWKEFCLSEIKMWCRCPIFIESQLNCVKINLKIGMLTSDNQILSYESDLR